MKSYLKTREMNFYFPIFFKFVESTMVYPIFMKGSGRVDLPTSTYAREFVIAIRMSVQHAWNLRSPHLCLYISIGMGILGR